MDQNPIDREQQQPPKEEREQQTLRLHRARWQFAYPMLAVAFIFLFSAILQSTADSIIRMTAPALAGADWYPWVLSMLPMYLVAMPISLIIFRLCEAETPEKKPMTFPVWLGILGICFALTYAGNLIGSVVNLIISILTGQPVINELASMTSSSPFWVNLLFVGILAPIMEEIFYRKLLIDRWRRYGEVPAMLLSALVFGLIHGNFSQFFYAAAVGALFGYVYLRTGKIRYTVFLHMTINLVGGVYTTEMVKLLTPILESGNPVPMLFQNRLALSMLAGYMLFMFAAVVGGIVAAVLLWKRWRAPFASPKDPLHEREWRNVLLLNPGTWMLGVVVLMLFLV